MRPVRSPNPDKHPGHVLAILGTISCVLMYVFALGSASADGLPDIDSANFAPVVGRWDLLPIGLADRVPAAVTVGSLGNVWVLTNGGIATYSGGPVAKSISKYDGGLGENALPSIIGHSIFGLKDGRLLASTIWREIFVIDKDRIARLTDRDISGSYSFAMLTNDRIAIALDDWRWLDATLETKIESVTGQTPFRVNGSYSALTTLGIRLFAAASQGKVSEISNETGEPLWTVDYDDRGSVSSFRASDDGYLYIGTTPWYGPGGCYRVSIEEHTTVEKFYEASCYDILPGSSGTIWASVEDGIYKFNGKNWLRYHRSGMGGIGFGGKFARDDAGNLWVASSLGLWRHYDYLREILPPDGIAPSGKIEGIFLAPNNSLYIAVTGDKVFQRQKGEGWKPVIFPPSQTNSPYYLKPVFAADSTGQIWMLTADGLFSIAGGTANRVGGSPIATGSSVPASLTACADDTLFAGLLWSNKIFKYENAKWSVAYELKPDYGGSSVPATICDNNSNVWAVGTSTVAVRNNFGVWEESSSIPIRPNVKKNLFGAITAHDNEAIAWGSWGYAVRLTMRDGHLEFDVFPDGTSMVANTPYVYRKVQAASPGNYLVLTDLGIFRAGSGSFERIPIIDERYQYFTTDIATIPNPNLPMGIKLFILADGRLFEVIVPSKPPTVQISGPERQVFTNETLIADIQYDAPVGPPEKGKIEVTIKPSVSYDVLRTATGYRVIIPKAENWQSYVLSASYVDGAGQRGVALPHTLLFQRPWVQDPYIVTGFTVGVLILIATLFRNRVVADFIVRRVFRRKWRVITDQAEWTIGLSLLQSGELSAFIERPGATLKGSDTSRGRKLHASVIREHILKLSRLAPNATNPTTLSTFSEQLTSLRNKLDAALPPLISQELRVHSHSEIQFELDRSLSDLPWDIISTEEQEPLMASCATARIISTDVTVSTPTVVGALRAVIFAAKEESDVSVGWYREQAEVAETLRSSGVKHISTLIGSASKTELMSQLASTDIVHLIGHGDIDENDVPYFALSKSERLKVHEIRETLRQAGESPALVFINACGSLEERRDAGGSVLAGLATPFLEAGSIVIGTFWPVQSLFASEIARVFYENALPKPSTMVFRLIRGQPLAGLPFSHALRIAREALYRKSPHTDPTWSAYSLFGSATARLELT